MSREHFISEGVLGQLGPGLEVSGAAWQSGADSVPVSAKSFAAKILCERHNSMLSEADAEGARFTSAFLKMLSGWEKGEPIESKESFQGDLLERWFLKVITGLAFSRQFRRRGERLRWAPSRSWNQLLFGATPFPLEAGLHLERTPGIVWGKGLGILPTWRNDECVGGRVDFLGVAFLVTTRAGTELRRLETSTGAFEELIRRPAAVRFRWANGGTDMRLMWTRPSRPKALTFYADEGLRSQSAPDPPQSEQAPHA